MKQAITPTVDSEVITSVFTADLNSDKLNDIFIVTKNTNTQRVSFKVAF